MKIAIFFITFSIFITVVESSPPSVSSASGEVLLKRYPRQAVSVSIPVGTVSTPLPIQKSNVVAERIRLMAQQEAQQAKKTVLPATTTPAEVATTVPPTTPPTTTASLTGPHIVTLYKVDSDAFESCDIGGGQRVGQVKIQDPQSHTGSITLPPSLLAIEDNYFLGKFSQNRFLLLLAKTGRRSVRCLLSLGKWLEIGLIVAVGVPAKPTLHVSALDKNKIK